MKEKTLNVYPWIFVVASVVMCLLDFFVGLARTYIDMFLPLGASLVMYFIYIGLCIAYGIFLIVTVLLMITRVLRGNIYIILTLVFTVAFLVVVRSESYAMLYHNAFRIDREEIVASYISGDKSDFKQIDSGVYFTGDVRISNDGSFNISYHDRTDEPDEVFVFDVYAPTGKKRILVYVPDGRALDDDFNYYGQKLGNIKDLDNGWYLGVLTD
jgi:hypothetical protein